MKNKVYRSMKAIEKDFFPYNYVENLNSIIIELPRWGKTVKLKCPYCHKFNVVKIDQEVCLCRKCSKYFEIRYKKLFKVTTAKYGKFAGHT